MISCGARIVLNALLDFVTGANLYKARLLQRKEDCQSSGADLFFVAAPPPFVSLSLRDLSLPGGSGNATACGVRICGSNRDGC